MLSSTWFETKDPSWSQLLIILKREKRGKEIKEEKDAKWECEKDWLFSHIGPKFIVWNAYYNYR